MCDYAAQCLGWNTEVAGSQPAFVGPGLEPASAEQGPERAFVEREPTFGFGSQQAQERRQALVRTPQERVHETMYFPWLRSGAG